MPDGLRHADVSATSDTSGALRIELLGGFRAAVAEQFVAADAWRLTKARSLVKLLALAPGHQAHREQILDTLWPDLEPAAASNNLHQALYAARRALATVMPGGAATPALQLRRQVLVLAPPAGVVVDVLRFEQLARVALQAGDTAACYAAIDAYGGELLPEDRYEAWAVERREALRDTVGALLLRLAQLHAERREATPAIEALRRVVAAEPTREEAHVGLMRLYALTGRRTQALRQYARLRETLERELDVEPDEAAAELYDDIVAERFPVEPWSREPPTPTPTPALAVVAAPRGAGLFVNRERELDALTRALREAVAGRSQVAVLAGEPGIGKTRAVEELAARARAQGARVLWGRCYEGAGAPAYWPWLQIVRAHARDLSADTLRADLGDGAAVIGRIAPELRAALPVLGAAPATLDPDHERFRLFDSMTNLVQRAAARQPLLLVLDDLHWADRSSLLLLEFMSGELGGERVFVVATYRDAGLDRRHPLTRTLGVLTRRDASQRLHVVGLDLAHVERYSALASGGPPPHGLAEAIHQQTEGNPFFMREVVQLLLDEGRFHGAATDSASWRVSIPQGVREAIGLRLDRLSHEAHRLLGVAAVIGREFWLTVLAEVAGVTRAAALDALEAALAAGAVTESATIAGDFRFMHVLIQQALYEEFSLARRAELHGAVAEALERLQAGNLAPYLATLAAHYALALPIGDADKAIEYAGLAGAQAMERVAYAEAAAHFARGLDILERHAPADIEWRFTLTLRLGEAQRNAGDSSAARATYERAVTLARAERSAAWLATAVVGTVETLWMTEVWDEAGLGLLEEALAAHDGSDSPLRVRLLAYLVRELTTALAQHPDALARAQALSDEAVAIAERLNDPATRVVALTARHSLLWSSARPHERLVNATEILRLARQCDDRRLVLTGLAWRIHDLMELGEVAAVDVANDDYLAIAEELRQPQNIWAALARRTMRATMAGRFDEAEQLARDCLAIGRRAASRQAADANFLHLCMIRLGQGRLDELAALADEMAERFSDRSYYRALLALLCVETGRDDRARQLVNELASADFSDWPRNLLWLSSLVTLAQVCASLSDTPRARALRELLTPYAGRVASGGGNTTCHGAVDHYLGLLCAALNDHPAAERYFASAVDLNERMGARAFVAESQLAWSQSLATRASADERARARELLDVARETGVELGMLRLVARTGELGRRLDVLRTD